MNKFFDFLKQYGLLIIIMLLILIWFKSCGIDNECTRNRKAIIELTKEINKKDSIIDESIKIINHKMDSTLISNSAVVNSNNATKNAINNQKQQQVVVKLIPNKE